MVGECDFDTSAGAVKLTTSGEAAYCDEGSCSDCSDLTPPATTLRLYIPASTFGTGGGGSCGATCDDLNDSYWTITKDTEDDCHYTGTHDVCDGGSIDVTLNPGTLFVQMDIASSGSATYTINFQLTKAGDATCLDRDIPFSGHTWSGSPPACFRIDTGVAVQIAAPA